MPLTWFLPRVALTAERIFHAEIVGRGASSATHVAYDSLTGRVAHLFDTRTGELLAPRFPAQWVDLDYMHTYHVVTDDPRTIYVEWAPL
jgi:hypothetical protein